MLGNSSNVGAASREYKADRLEKRLMESQMLRQLESKGGSIKDFDWYINVYRKYETAPHAGCGIGLNRVTQFVLGVDDIRMCTAYPLNKETLVKKAGYTEISQCVCVDF